MLSTSSQEGKLQERTEPLKATSGAPNGFVRPVAVASIFRPASGGSSGFSGVDGNPAVPVKRRSVTAKENKPFGSSLSNEEFSRRRQSFNIKDVISLGQNVITQTSGKLASGQSLPNSEGDVVDQVSTVDEKCDEKSKRERTCGEIQNAAGKKSKDDDRCLRETTAAAKSVGTAKTETAAKEEKEKNSKNVSHVKSEKSSGPESAKVTTGCEGNASVIQNGVVGVSKITALETKSRFLLGSSDYVQKSPATQTERRRRNRFPLNTPVDKDIAPDCLGVTKVDFIPEGSSISSRDEKITEVKSDTVTCEVVSSRQILSKTECVQQPVAPHSEGRRRVRTPQDPCIEQNRAAKVVGKPLSSQKSPEADCNVITTVSSTTEAKCELPTDVNKSDASVNSSDKKQESVDAVGAQSGSKCRTGRRTSDVIAAKIQSFLSKSDKPVTQQLSNKLNPTKDKLGTLGVKNESEPGICSAENDSALCSVLPEQKGGEVKKVSQKESSSGSCLNTTSHPVLPLPSKSGALNVKTSENVKCPANIETSSSTEDKLKCTNKTQLVITNSTADSNIVHSLQNKEKSVLRSYVKDSQGKFNQQLQDSTFADTVPSIANHSAGRATKSEAAASRTGITATTKKEISSTGKELSSNSLLFEDKKVTPVASKKPVASINFLITEVTVQNSTLPLKINTGKVSPLLAVGKEPSQNIEQKSGSTQSFDTKKCANNDSSVRNLTSVSVTKLADKSKVGKTFPLEDVKRPSATEQQQSSLIQNSISKGNANSDTKARNSVSSKPLVNSESVALKSLGKDKINKTGPSKEESKAELENLLQKHGQGQKSSAGKIFNDKTKDQSGTSSQPRNFASKLLTSSEKDKIGQSLPLNESAKPELENCPQKYNAQSDIGKIQSVDGSGSLNSGVQAVKPLGKEKVGKALLPKAEKVELEKLLQKGTGIQKSNVEVKVNSDTKAQNAPNSDFSTIEALKPSSVDNKVSRSVPLKAGIKTAPEISQQKSNSGINNANCGIKPQGSVCTEVVDSRTQVLKPEEKDKIGSSSLKVDTQVLKPEEKDKIGSSSLKVDIKGPAENFKQKSNQVQKLGTKDIVTSDLRAHDVSGSQVVNSGSAVLKQSEKDKVSEDSELKEHKIVSKNLVKKSSAFQKWGARENADVALKSKSPITSSGATTIPDALPPKQFGSVTNKTLTEKNESELLSEVVKQRRAEQNLGTKEPVSCNSNTENITSATKSVSSCGGSEINPVAGVCKSDKLSNKIKATPKVKKILKQEQKPDDVNSPVAEKIMLTEKKVSSPAPNAECSETEGLPSVAKSVQLGKAINSAELVSSFQSPTTNISEKQESGAATMKQAKHSFFQTRNSAVSKAGATKAESPVVSTDDELVIHQDTLKTNISSHEGVIGTSSGKQMGTVLTNSVTPVEDMSKYRNSPVETSIVKHAVKDLTTPVRCETKDSSTVSLESSRYGSKTPEICKESQNVSGGTLVKDVDFGSGAILSTDTCLTRGESNVFNKEFYGRSSSFSKFETPRPPERKRLGFLHEISTPPRVPLRSPFRTGSLKRPDDSRLSLERPMSILRSSSHSVLGPSYTSQRITYTEMLSKLGTCGRDTPLTTSNKKFGISQVSELWGDLSEEQSNSAHMSEMLESETSERMSLEKEVQELQSRYSQVQKKSDKMEMEMMEARVYRATEVNGDLSEEDETDATVSIYKQKYERAVRDMEIMKRRLQQQHEEELEQSLMLKKAADKRLTEALEDIEEERQVINQWKRKAQKLGAELQDLRLMLEEQMARNGELEKKQRRFDAELSAAQEEIRKEHQLREKLTRERDQAQLEKYSLEQELQATRLDMDMQHEKIALLNRELDELSLSSKGEEEVTQLKRAKQELERKARDQEEELEELAGQAQMLEQAKLRLEMSLEKLRQEHRRESSVRDEEIEEIRAGSSKKIKNLEAQLENEQEERHQLVKQKHELERRIIELSDQPPPQDPEIERRLRRDLKRTKALLRDAQGMLEHMRDGQANKTLIRQLKNQLEDAEFTKSVAIKARQSAELELQELQSQLEEVTRTKNDIESRCLQLSREKSAVQAQLEEMEEEMAEVMKKYKAAVSQMSIDQKSLAEQLQLITELEGEKMILKDQLAEVSTKLDHISVQTEDSSRVHRLDAKVRDLESKLELEQTTRSRLEHQIARLKEQCDRSREECDSLRSKELQAQEATRRLQRQLRELREDYAALQQKESEAYRKQHELEMSLENTEADLQVTKNDLRLACQRIQDLQNALEDDLDSGTDVPDDSGSESDSSLDVSMLGRPCLTPLQHSDSVSSNISIGGDVRPFGALSHSQDMSYFSRMMQRRTSTDFLV